MSLGYYDGSANGVKGENGPRKPRVIPYRKPPTLRVGRNQPCPCKSGKKFKHCCLSKVQALENLPPELRQQAIISNILRKPL